MRRSTPAIAFLLSAVASLAFAYDDDAIVAQCDAEWGTDFSMVAFCREQQRSAGVEVDELRERAGAGDELIRTILNRCETEWGKDYSMIKFCVDQQSKSVRALEAIPEDVPKDIAETIRSQCDEEWGTDFSMVSFCVEQQTKAWRELN